MIRKNLILAALMTLTLAACDPYSPTMHPDYAIRVTPTAAGGVATPPACPSWSSETTDPFDNQPVPQFGCADAQNLSAMVEKPNDLIIARPIGDARGVTTVGAIRRYDNNQPRGLIGTGEESNVTAVTTAPAAASTMTGDVTNVLTGPAAAGASTGP